MYCTKFHPFCFSNGSQGVELPISNRQVTAKDHPGLDFMLFVFSGEEATYKCYDGSWIEPGKVTVSLSCEKDGDWSPTPSSVACERMFDCMPLET